MLVGKVIKLKRGVVGTIVSVNGGNIALEVNGKDKLASYSIGTLISNDLFDGIDPNDLEEIKSTYETYLLEKEKKENEEYELNHINYTSNKSIINWDKVDKLIYLNKYGTNSKEIYEKCCDRFGFDKAYIDKLGWHKGTFVDEAIKDYSVWFISNSKINDQENDNWYNDIHEDIIDEYRKTEKYNDFSDSGRKRLVFVKDSKGEYTFYGVYIFDSFDSKKKFKRYKRIQKNYINIIY